MPKWRFVRAGSADRVRTDHLGTRVLRVIREVLFQSRVISGRPVVGTLHAMVFFGFICFAFETTDHFLEPFNIAFLATVLGSAGLPVFQSFLAFVAVLVMIGISGLAFRRFVMVKISPDPKSWTSGLVALMIFLLMVTYLYSLNEQAGWQKANWWLHALLILAFLPLILHSKHFHILMGPVNVFLRNKTLGEYLPLDLEAISESEEEVSLGLEDLQDVTWKMRLDFVTCVECKRCTDNCPAAISGQELQPREFILAGRAMMGKQEGAVIGNIISETALGQCTSCGACENICPVGVEHLQVLNGAKRAQAMAIGQGMVADDFLQAVEKRGNPFSEPKSKRKKLLQELSIPLFEKGKTEYLLWMGCVWTYNEDSRGSLESLLQVLNKAGVSYGVLEEESCSGHHSRRQGEEFQFQTLANENMQRFEAQAVEKILSPCPHCLHTIGREYPTVKADFSVETTHHSELLTELMNSGRLQINAAMDGKRITYHDPCYLGRYEGVYDAPRQLIEKSSTQFVELPRHGARSFCCGGGAAGFTRTQESDGKRVDQERKREIVDSGAQVLVTSCPECKMMLDSAVEETMDIAELVARSADVENHQVSS